MGSKKYAFVAVSWRVIGGEEGTFDVSADNIIPCKVDLEAGVYKVEFHIYTIQEGLFLTLVV